MYKGKWNNDATTFIPMFVLSVFTINLKLRYMIYLDWSQIFTNLDWDAATRIPTLQSIEN